MSYVTMGEGYFDPMVDSDRSVDQFTTRLNTTITSKVRVSLDPNQLAEEIRLLEALPRVVAAPSARALYFRVKDRLNDPWLIYRLSRLL